MSLPTLKLANTMEKALASGHPWIYRNHLPAHAAATLPPSCWVRLEAGQAVAFGRYDAQGAIGVRIFSHTQVPDEAWIVARVHQAVALRAPLVPITNAYRVLYGESDGLPAITADLYERYVVIKTYAASVEDLLPAVAKGLRSALPQVALSQVRGILHRHQHKPASEHQTLVPLVGELPPPEVTVTERGFKLLANLYEGQKTGLFLDHRDNRQHVARVCQGKRVLNLFCYTGAFSLYAERGGATHVTSVDIAKGALADAARNVQNNSKSYQNKSNATQSYDIQNDSTQSGDIQSDGIQSAGADPAKHTFLAEDCFAFLAQHAQTVQVSSRAPKAAPAPFDVIICDPPSFARNKEQRANAIRAYTKLNRDALAMLPVGGMLATASCTAQVSPQAFKDLLANAAAQAGCAVQIIGEAGHALDHPVALHFPEGRYLKFLLLRKCVLA